MEESQRPRTHARVAAMKVLWNDSGFFVFKKSKMLIKMFAHASFPSNCLKRTQKGPATVSGTTSPYFFFFFFSLNHFYKSVCSGLCKELNNEKGILFEIIYLGIGLINSISDLTFYAGGRKDQKVGKHLYYRQTLSTEQILPV